MGIRRQRYKRPLWLIFRDRTFSTDDTKQPALQIDRSVYTFNIKNVPPQTKLTLGLAQDAGLHTRDHGGIRCASVYRRTRATRRSNSIFKSCACNSGHQRSGRIQRPLGSRHGRDCVYGGRLLHVHVITL